MAFLINGCFSIVWLPPIASEGGLVTLKFGNVPLGVRFLVVTAGSSLGYAIYRSQFKVDPTYATDEDVLAITLWLWHFMIQVVVYCLRVKKGGEKEGN